MTESSLNGFPSNDIPERIQEDPCRILKSFNDAFGNIPWEDKDRIHRLMTQDIPRRVAEDPKYKAAMLNSDKKNARVEHARALMTVMMGVMRDDTQLFKQFLDNADFKRWLQDRVFEMTYDADAPGPSGGKKA